MNKLDNAIYEGLLSEGLANKADLDGAVKKSAEKDMPFYSWLVAEKKIDEEKMLRLVSRVSDIPYVNLHDVEVDSSAIKAVPAKFAWYYKFAPLKLDGSKVTVAIDRLISISVQDELRLMLGLELSFLLAKKNQVEEILKHHYGLAADTVDKMVAEEEKDTKGAEKAHAAEPKMDDIEKLAGDASVVKLVNQIILEAYKKRATDIHFEPFRGRLRIRYRIDGILQDQKVPEEVNRFMMPMLSRIKIMSNLNIVEKRMPQDGRTSVKTQEEVLDLRVSFIPTQHGESVVIRILPTKAYFGLERLGLSPEDMSLIRTIIHKPSGIIFATGPTGSGKSTTLYACLKEINSPDKKIITIEDPVEYEMENITQIQVNERSGLTFAKGLRSMLRHDPDVMMVGEVRDRETAEIAIRVSLTGHLVLSTLHTNDSATGVTRLVDIGIEPYLVASSVEAFIAQRLIRTICPKCKIEDTSVVPEIKRRISESRGGGDMNDLKIYKGKGCDDCNGTGFYGRTAIYEILRVDQEIKRLIIAKAPAGDVKRTAMRRGMASLMQNGWDKVLAGVTTPQEVLNVCQDLEESEYQYVTPGPSRAQTMAPPRPSGGTTIMTPPPAQ
ncbi:MAG: ATPase, T2SS/T4P/T4SS family, partial [Candidatus Omnitrophica bacterium]|nr:ATPase, T2SS/T4P/T4SS family [Candidatus Omnitrophota bacterium]